MTPRPSEAAGLRQRVRHAWLKTRAKMADAIARPVGWIEPLHLHYGVTAYDAPVSKGLLRGSRVDSRGLAALGARGVRSIVDLRRERTDEAAQAWALGMRSKHIPIPDNTSPTQADVHAFLDFVTRPENQPAYVHCQAGVGRTGVMVAAYRMAVQGWSAQQAIKDAAGYGLKLPNHKKFIRQLWRDLRSGQFRAPTRATTP